MTTDATAARSTTSRPRSTNGAASGGPGEAVQVAVREMRSAIDGVGRSMPEVARVSRSAVEELVQAVESGSDQQVTAGVSLSLGLAMGMLLGGAPRLLVLLALAPVAIIGLALADRRVDRGRKPAASS
jgi:hypothetical protein